MKGTADTIKPVIPTPNNIQAKGELLYLGSNTAKTPANDITVKARHIKISILFIFSSAFRDLMCKADITTF
ncbi:MAG: hypothetical protein ABSC49_00050 [Candidatus Microgenomates bacterium]|jgi:hypothetical protein